MKFSTPEELVYDYLIDELEIEIELCQQRVEILESIGDVHDAILEEKQLQKLKEKHKTLHQYKLEVAYKTTNAPHYLEIGHYNRFAKKIVDDEYNSFGLNDDSFNYYYENTHIKLKDWRELEENQEYIINNLTLKRVGDTLLTQYPHEAMWYELDDTPECENPYFTIMKNKEVYKK